MTRGQRLARQPASEKMWLNRKEADLINDARSLPDDHSSSDTEDPVWSIPRQTKPVLEVIHASGLVTECESRLRSHPGQKSRLSIDALLLGIILAAGLKQSYRRADICAVLNGLDAKVGYELGLWSPEDTRPISYNMVRKQLKRLEGSLTDGWTSPNGTPRDLAWFCHTFIAATIPPPVPTNDQSYLFGQHRLSHLGSDPRLPKRKRRPRRIPTSVARRPRTARTGTPHPEDHRN